MWASKTIMPCRPPMHICRNGRLRMCSRREWDWENGSALHSAFTMTTTNMVATMTFSQLFVAGSRRIWEYVMESVGRNIETDSEGLDSEGLEYWTFRICCQDAKKSLVWDLHIRLSSGWISTISRQEFIVQISGWTRWYPGL